MIAIIKQRQKRNLPHHFDKDIGRNLREIDAGPHVDRARQQQTTMIIAVCR